MGWNDFTLPGAGERFENADGTSRQEELERCSVGEEVRLVREPNNIHDHMAVAVISARGVQVGYLRSVHATWVGSKIDRGAKALAIIERIKGATLPDEPLGLVLRISLDGDEPELPINPDRVVIRVA